MAVVRVTWSENGKECWDEVNGVTTLQEATFIAAMLVEDVYNAKLLSAAFVVRKASNENTSAST